MHRQSLVYESCRGGAARNKLLTSISIRKKFPTKVISANLAPHFVSMARRGWSRMQVSLPG